MRDLFLSASLLTSLILTKPTPTITIVSPINKVIFGTQKMVAEQKLDLTKRHPDKQVNEIFQDNILLILHYLKGDAAHFVNKEKIDWKGIRQPFEVEFKLNPGETFSFHDKYLPEFEGKVGKTIPVKYTAKEGFKAVDGLYGNGVCHLATLMNWVASEAKLKTVALVNHDFFPVPETQKEYGVSIYYTGGEDAKRQNLYITNNFDFTVEFKFKADGKRVELKIVKPE